MALNKEEFLALLKFKMEGDKVFSQRVQKIQSEITGVGTQSDKTAKSGRNLGFSLVSVAKKAAIVAPAWILMRKAMMSAFKTITDGMEHIKALDKALARATAVTSGVKNGEV